MLVLSRQQDQQILFPTLGITISFVQMNSRRVRVGIEAPPAIPILRGEVVDEPDRRSKWQSPKLDKDKRCRQTIPVGDERLKRHLYVAAHALKTLSDTCKGELSPEANKCVEQVFHELNAIDSEAARFNDRPKSIDIQRRTALLVDDNANEAKLLAGFLRLRNFDVAIAEDGHAALQYLEDNRQPDVVLLDMVMPRLNGPETIRSIRQSESHQSLKVYGLSGGTPEEHGVAIDDNGVDGWFRKPVDPEDMIIQLRLDEQTIEHDDTLVTTSDGPFDRSPV